MESVAKDLAAVILSRYSTHSRVVDQIIAGRLEHLPSIVRVLATALEWEQEAICREFKLPRFSEPQLESVLLFANHHLSCVDISTMVSLMERLAARKELIGSLRHRLLALVLQTLPLTSVGSQTRDGLRALHFELQPSSRTDEAARWPAHYRKRRRAAAGGGVAEVLMHVEEEAIDAEAVAEILHQEAEERKADRLDDDRKQAAREDSAQTISGLLRECQAFAEATHQPSQRVTAAQRDQQAATLAAILERAAAMPTHVRAAAFVVLRLYDLPDDQLHDITASYLGSCSGADSVEQFISAAVLPKLRRLTKPASRVLVRVLEALLTYNAHVAISSLLCPLMRQPCYNSDAESQNPTQIEFVQRAVRQSMSPALLDRLLGQLMQSRLSSEAAELVKVDGLVSVLGATSGSHAGDLERLVLNAQALAAAAPTVSTTIRFNDAVCQVVTVILNSRVVLSEDTISTLIMRIDEAQYAPACLASAKFASMNHALVTKHGKQLANHVSVLSSVVSKCTSLVANSTLQALRKL